MSDLKQTGVNVDLNKVPNMRCDCGHNMFKQVFMFKKLSALISPTGKETLVPIQAFVCDKCGKLPEVFKNLNDTEDVPHAEGESVEVAVKKSDSMPETNALFLSKS